MNEKEFIISQGKLAEETMTMLNKYMFPGMKIEYSNLWNNEMKVHETYNKMTARF